MDLVPASLIRSQGRRVVRDEPMRVVNVHLATTHPSRLNDEAHADATIVLARAGKPWARLMPLAPPAPQRIPGRLRSRGPLSQSDVLLVPMNPTEPESWESGPLLPVAPPTCSAAMPSPICRDCCRLMVSRRWRSPWPLRTSAPWIREGVPSAWAAQAGSDAGVRRHRKLSQRRHEN